MKRILNHYYIFIIFLIIICGGCKKEYSIPIVTTYNVKDISYSTAQCGGTIISNGGLTILTKGVCWSTGNNPTINHNKTEHHYTLERFSSNLTGLSPGTTYYVRAYATNSLGTGYGNAVPFRTLDLMSKESFLLDLQSKNPSLQIIHTIIKGTEPDYYHFGFITRNPVTGSWISAFRLGIDHIGDEGKIMFSRSFDGWTWTQYFKPFVNTKYDDRHLAGGYTSSGRLYLFYGVYNAFVSKWVYNSFIYSDDEGILFSPERRLITFNPDCESGGVYGHIVELENGTILVGWHGRKENQNSIGYFSSTDNGIRWQLESIISTGNDFIYAEPSLVHLGDNRILCVCRKSLKENNTTYHQFYSPDGGKTWIDQGDTNFETWGITPGQERPPFLAMINYFGSKIVACYYVVTTSQKLKVIYGLASNAINGVSMWDVDTIEEIMNVYEYHQTHTTRDGYQTVVHIKNKWPGIGQIFLEPTHGKSAICIFQTPESNKEKVLNELGCLINYPVNKGTRLLQ